MMKDPEQVCPWAVKDPLYRKYHDTEWGVALHDDCKLFELLILEGMQAGLSWLTVLRKRERFRQVFAGFDPAKVAVFDEGQIESLLQDPGIIRNRLKIKAAVNNAAAFLRVQSEFASFDRYLWSWVDGQPIINNWQMLAQIPARTALSDKISKDMQRRGFSFAGSTICYALMQSAGLVWDHLASCPCRPGQEALS